MKIKPGDAFCLLPELQLSPILLHIDCFGSSASRNTCINRSLWAGGSFGKALSRKRTTLTGLREAGDSAASELPEEWLLLLLEECFFLSRCQFPISFHLENTSATIVPFEEGLKWMAWTKQMEVSLLSSQRRSMLFRFVSYQYYRSMGWVVRDGMKYGADWLLYPYGPAYDHALYAVFTLGYEGAGLRWSSLSQACRLLSNVRKKIRICFIRSLPLVDEPCHCSTATPRIASSLDLSQYEVIDFELGRWIPESHR